MNKNEKLIALQKKWEEQCYHKLKNAYEQNEKEKGKLSCAFSFGLSDHYLKGEKKVMVVGQEARGHTFEYKEWNLINWQKWAIDYLNFQIYDDPSPNFDLKKNNSPFWQFIRKIRETGADLCWNDLDKVRRYIQPDGDKWKEDYLPYDKKNTERALLNGKIFDGKSLLQREIEIADPNFIIFVCGPANPYYHTLCNAFFDEEDAYEKLNDKRCYPTAKEPLVEISQKLGLKIPAFYTYHPNYLQMSHKFEGVVDELAKQLK